MRSRTSFFNFSVLRKNLQRSIPLLIIYTLFWLVVLPMRFMNSAEYYMDPERSRYLFREILEMGNAVSSFVMLFYGIALAMVLFSYLYNARSTNMIHAFPIRREGLFVTNYVSGLLCCFVPNLLVACITMIVLQGTCTDAIWQWFMMSGLQFVFFFSFAVLLAQLTGHIVALPIIYFVLNFTVIVLEYLLSYLLPSWVYGMPSLTTVNLTEWSPLVHLIANTSVRYTEAAAYYNGWDYLYILAAVGAAMSFVAFLLYRKRKIESAGDAIAIRALRPVFKYCVTIGCAIVLGMGLVSVLDVDLRFGNYISVPLCMILGAFIGYFGSEMVLKKKIGVFKKEWLGFAVVSVLIVILPWLCSIDAFGYSSYIPDRDEIVGVNFDHWGSDERFTGDADTIDAVYALHQELIENPPIYEEDLYDMPIDGMNGSNYTSQISYKLKNGTTVLREYEFFMTDNKWHLNYDLSQRVMEVQNLPTLLMLEYCPMTTPTRSNIVNAVLEFHLVDEYGSMYYGGSYELTAEEVLRVYEDCIVPDLLDGTLYTHTYFLDGVETSSSTIAEGSANLPAETTVAYFYLSFYVMNRDGGREYVNASVDEVAERTFAALSELKSQYDTQ